MGAAWETLIELMRAAAGDERMPVASVDERSAELLFRHQVIHLLQGVGLF